MLLWRKKHSHPLSSTLPFYMFSVFPLFGKSGTNPWDQEYANMQLLIKQGKQISPLAVFRRAIFCSPMFFNSYVYDKWVLWQGINSCSYNVDIFSNVLLLFFRTQLRLDGLEDAYVLEDEYNDRLTDKHGCPAYVSPEILNANESYSGRSADIWSLGVMLYTMLVGRYPFHDSEATALFGKIRRGQFTIPRNLSSKAKCLIKSILRRDPSERLTSSHVLQHPWIKGSGSGGFLYLVDPKSPDQTVPEVKLSCEEDDIY